MSDPLPPFLAGESAFNSGEKISANPHPVRIDPEDGDGYPGPFHNWRDGWRAAKFRKQHREKLEKEREMT